MSTLRCWLLLTVALSALAACRAATSANLVNVESDVLHFSYELERWLDTDKRPCQDFFGYVCGKSLNSSQEQLEQRLAQEQLKFDKFLLADNDEQLMDAELKLKQFYDACKNARSAEDLKSTMMYRLSGGWPAIDDSTLMARKRRNMTWMDVVSTFHDTGLMYFFWQRVEIKSNKRVVHIEPNESKRYSLRKFEQLAEEVLQTYAVDAGRARLIALEIMNFERNRRDIVKMEVESGAKEYSYEQFKALQFGKAGQMDWDGYFKKILGKSLRASDTIVVSQQAKLVQAFEQLQNTTITRLLNWIWIDYLMGKSLNDCQSLSQRYFEPIYQHVVERASLDKVQLAQMYADLGRAYDELLPNTTWIDEMSQQNSKQFLGRVIHLTLNGDEKLDTDYADITITKRNFYRNLEKAQRFLAQRERSRTPAPRTSSSSFEIATAATDFMKVFLNINTLLQQQNLTTPLNYVAVGEHFAEHMIASGSSSSTPGAWRSMDSERDFNTFKQCIARQQNSIADAATKYNLNALVLKLLAQQQTLQALEQWQQKNMTLMRRLDSLLSAGRLQLSLRKLYFIGSVLTDCRQYADMEQRELVHAYLRNSAKFAQAFRCRSSDALQSNKVCKVF